MLKGTVENRNSLILLNRLLYSGNGKGPLVGVWIMGLIPLKNQSNVTNKRKMNVKKITKPNKNKQKKSNKNKNTETKDSSIK